MLDRVDVFTSIKAVAICLALFSITLGVNIEITELRHYFQIKAGDDTTILAASFSSYVLGLIFSLICFGGLADKIGPRLMIIYALAASILSLSILIIFDITFFQIVISRVLRGVSVGLVLSASAVALFEVMGKTTTSVNLHSGLLALGLGGGGLFTLGLGVSSDEPLMMSALALLLVQLALISLIFAVRNLIGAKKLNQGKTFPRFSRQSTWAYLGIFMAWSFVGVMITFSSQLIAAEWGRTGSALIIFLAVGTGGLVQPFFRDRNSIAILWLGLLISNIALVLLVIGEGASSLAIIMFSAMCCGVASLGVLYTVCIKGVLSVATVNESGLLSGFFLCGYLGLGLPCILIGIVADLYGIQVSLQTFWLFYVLMTMLLLKVSAESHFFNNKEILY